MWPVDLDCVNFRPKFIFDEPREKEPFYQPEHEVPIPPILSSEHSYGRKRKIHTVYTNEPGPGDWFTSSRRGPSLNLRAFAPRSPEDISLSFESRFECGNLRKAIQVGKWEYELYMRCDLYTDKHTQWFYFGVRNMRPGQTYRFTIVNFYKSGSLYNSGMKPLFYSEKQASLKGIGWRRQGFNVKYFKTNIRRWGRGEQNHYALTWSCQFPHLEDTCYFAHCYPYTYTDLKEYIQSLCSKPEVSKFCKHRTLCHTVAGNPVPLLTIAAPSLTLEEAKSKKAVVVTARVHPGESNSSWMMKGLIDFLTSSHQDARILREMFVFKIIPMLNPDGVIVGNYRCSLAGRDLNRNYLTDLKGAYPTIWHSKAMVQRLVRERQVVLYCDLHGHSRRQNVFIYGCNGLPGENPKKPKGLTLLERVFPKMMSLNASDKFSYKYSTFSVRKSKEGTGRVSMWRQMGILNSFTMEATFCGSNLEGHLQGRHFTTRDFEAMGFHFCDTLLDYCDPDQTNVNFVLHQLQEERREMIVKQMSSMGLEIPPDTDPLELESRVLPSIDSGSSDDGGSDSSVSDGDPIGNFDLTPSAPEHVVKRKKKHKKKKSKTKRSSTTVPKLKMTHKEGSKPSSPPPPNLSGPSTQPDMETKQKTADREGSGGRNKTTAVPHPLRGEGRESTGSLLSSAGGTVPTVHYRHRHSGTGGIPIYVKERMEERQRRRSDADSHTSITASGFGSEAGVHLDTAWSLHKLPMGTLSNYWRHFNTPSLNISSLVPQRQDGVAEGNSISNVTLPHVGSHTEGDLLPTDSAHMLASQMRALMEKCNLPVNPTSNLVSLSRFFRNARPPLGGRRVYMDMVRTLQRSNHSHTSLCGTSGRRSRGVADQPSCESVSSSKSFSKQEMFYPDDSVDKESLGRGDQSDLGHQRGTAKSVSQCSIPLLPALSTSCSVTTTELPVSEKRKTPQLGLVLSEDLPSQSDPSVNPSPEPHLLDGGYDSDNESDENSSSDSCEDDDEDNPVGVTMTLTDKAKEESQPTFTIRQDYIELMEEERDPPSPLEREPHPLPKSYSVPTPRTNHTSLNDSATHTREAANRHQDDSHVNSIGARLSSAVIKGPATGVGVRQHKDRVAAAVEAIEGMKFSSSERVQSCQPRRTERGLPSAVLFSGSNLKEVNLRVSDSSDPLLPHHYQQHQSTEGAGSKGRSGFSTSDRPSSKWQQPAVTTFVDGGQLPTIPQKSSGEGHQQLWQMRYASLLERLQPQMDDVEHGRKQSQSTRPATRGYTHRPGSSKPEAANHEVVPKSVTLDFLPRLSHTSHGRTRPVLPQ
jgi:hypothetical protein